MNSRLTPVALAVRALLGISGAAFLSVASADELPMVYVYATAIDEDPDKIASSFSVLDGEKLFEQTQATLGDTLGSLPGVHSDTFGGGATRPVIRGQSAPRVTVLSDSGRLLDASDISPDHAVTAEPLLVERIEVLRGPATLLYGSGAIGGVVNLLDRKIPTALPEGGIDGSVALRGGTVSNEKAVAAELTARIAGGLVAHIEGTKRDADDYRVPGWEERRVDGTHAASEGLSAGLSWVGEKGYLGLAYSWREDDYGLPGHDHEYEGCHPHGSSLHCGDHEEEEEHDHDHEHEHGEAPTIALQSRRWDLRGQIDGPFAGIERIRLRASYTDYRHDELEEDEIATTFLNEGYEARVELQHAPLGSWRGVFGAQYSDTDSSAAGEEAFLPSVKSRSVGLFIVEHYELSEALHFEVGARQEWGKHRPVNDPRGRPAFSDSATSFSGAAVWQFMPDNYLTLSAARSERLPHSQELYARGIHLATNTYECGMVPHPLTCGAVENNADIRTETSHSIELAYRRTAGALTVGINGYYNQADNYIYARTLDQYEDFRLIKYSQRDVTFRGMEAEATWQFSPRFAATVFGDFVRADFDDGGDLPRIPAARIGARLNGEIGLLGGELEYYRVNEQTQTADFESTTPGYNMLNLTLRYRAEGSPLSLYVRGSNLLDETVWNHASFLSGVVPLPGRGLSAGVRLMF